MDTDATSDATRGSRRDLLKKAGVGAAIVWTAPVVSSIVTPAAAQTGGVTPVGECGTYYILKVDAEGDGAGTCDNNQNPQFPCVATTAPDGTPWAGGCAVSTVNSYDTSSVSVLIPDNASNIAGYVKTSTACSPASTSVGAPSGGQVLVTVSGDVISHIVIIFCLPDVD